MVARTVKIMGSSYATSGTVNITVDYNGSRVYAGPVPTTIVNVIPINQPNLTPNWEQELGIFETDTTTTGFVPVVISVTGGTVFFGHFWMNYIGPAYQREQTNPNTPIDPNNPDTFRWVMVADTQSNYGDPNTNNVDTDGLTNTKLNGQPWAWRVNVGDQVGDWAYPISSGNTFSFDFYVDPEIIILTNN